MAEKALDLLQRIAEEPTIAFRAGLVVLARGSPQAMLDQHREHVHGEGMPKLVRADAEWTSGGCTATAGAREHDLPGIGLHGLADLGQPERAGSSGKPSSPQITSRPRSSGETASISAVPPLARESATAPGIGR